MAGLLKQRLVFSNGGWSTQTEAGLFKRWLVYSNRVFFSFFIFKRRLVYSNRKGYPTKGWSLKLRLTYSNRGWPTQTNLVTPSPPPPPPPRAPPTPIMSNLVAMLGLNTPPAALSERQTNTRACAQTVPARLASPPLLHRTTLVIR